MLETIFGLVFLDILLFIAMTLTIFDEEYYFYPKENYENWYALNWFGVWFFTILYWIIFLPVTILILIWKLFTIGRR